jgi:hypothetical protein
MNIQNDVTQLTSVRLKEVIAAFFVNKVSNVLSLAIIAVLLAGVGWSSNSVAANALAGIWQINGNDTRLGTYTGSLEVRERTNDSTLDVIRLVHLDHYTHTDGRGVDLVWTGTATNDPAKGVQVNFALAREDFIPQVGNLVRSAADAAPLQVIGRLEIQGNVPTIRYTAVDDPSLVITETVLQHDMSGLTPIWQAQRLERDTHADLQPFTLDETLKLMFTFIFPSSGLNVDALQANPHEYLFQTFAGYHQLPAVQPSVLDPLFQRAVHLKIQDRTDFDYYQQNPDRLRVINKVVDPISLAETAVRANAFRLSPADKAKLYQEELTHEFVGAHGMVVRSIDAAGQAQPDNDSALWTGVYIYTQALRYKHTGEEEALANLRRSLKGILTLLDITGQSGIFARTLRPHAADVAVPWHAGSGEFAAYDWLEGGNNDMVKGIILGMIASWDVLPTDDPLHDAISGHARRLLKLDLFDFNFDDLGSNSALAYLLAGVTDDGFFADINVATAQTMLRNPMLKQYVLSGGGPFYIFGISDWSGNHLTLVTALALQQLLAHTNASDLQTWWAQAPAKAWEKNLRGLDSPLHAALAASSSLFGANVYNEAIEQVQWGLRSFPYPKQPYTVDHRKSAGFVMSPLPSFPWKFDWLTNSERQQSIRAYPLFEQSIDEYRWNDGPFTIASLGLGERRVPGVDYLFLYWLSRNSALECLLNWAEVAYMHLLLPSPALTRFQAPTIYRYYRDTKAFIFVSAIDQHVYYQGSNGVKVDVGSLSDWLATASCH